MRTRYACAHRPEGTREWNKRALRKSVDFAREKMDTLWQTLDFVLLLHIKMQKDIKIWNVKER